VPGIIHTCMRAHKVLPHDFHKIMDNSVRVQYVHVSILLFSMQIIMGRKKIAITRLTDERNRQVQPI